MDDIADRKLPPLEDVLRDLAAHLPGWVLVEAEEEARYKDEIERLRGLLAERDAEIAKLMDVLRVIEDYADGLSEDATALSELVALERVR